MSVMLDQRQPQTFTRVPGMPAPLLSDEEWSTWKRRLMNAKNDRRRFEPNWLLNLAFCAGKMWLEWKPYGRGGRFILPQLKAGQQRYTVDEITDLRMTILGQFTQDDDRPQLLFRQDDLPTEDFADVANDALEAGWQTEWLGDRQLMDVKRIMIDLGTSAARCRFDPTAGPVRQKQVPHQDGQPILDPEKARQYVADQQAKGQSANLKSIHEGRVRWDVGTPFNLLVPSGIKREDKFPWECWMEPVHLSKVQETYGERAKGLKADAITDVDALGETMSTPMAGGDLDTLAHNIPVKLEDHVFVYTIYERPNQLHPDGRVIVMAGETFRVMEVRQSLDYEAPDGTKRSGIHYFHYVRLTDRFWSKSLLDLAKEINRAINKRRSQIAETIDRGQAFIITTETAKRRLNRQGVPMEVMGLPDSTPPPTINSGVTINPSWFQEIEELRTDLQRATGLQDVLQGNNPQNVGNYSQLALLQEQAAQKFSVTLGEYREALVHLVEDSVGAIRRWWGHDRLLALEGPDGTLKAFNFDATKIPPFYRLYPARGASQPRSQAAELKKVDDLATYSINSGQPLPITWVAESYDAGKPVELPETDRHDDLDHALYENQLLLQGGTPTVHYYQDHALHVQVVRSIQSQADATNNQRLSQACEQHVQWHLAQAHANALAAQLGQNPSDIPPPGSGMPPAAVPVGSPPLAPAGAAGASAEPPIPHPDALSLFLRSSLSGPGNFGG